ncbi:hypothetical protein MPF_1516 [Methanohalophilus portucalensis FDF-1]|uniref:Uncharacterized protein n=1 Tax=Methanohalophilus portucalensis FDF-1 TaxID=523843 RepID=A0A1L9C389_9EURY|nr:hypothetical protein MPF_1516 [Methanohalophilus portucalensis FDF-1]
MGIISKIEMGKTLRFNIILILPPVSIKKMKIFPTFLSCTFFF